MDRFLQTHLPHGARLYPRTGLDAYAIPSTLLLLVADNLTTNDLDILERKPLVVTATRFSDGTVGTTLVVTADFGAHCRYQLNRPDGEETNRLSIARQLGLVY
jgi:hypothetical protein